MSSESNLREAKTIPSISYVEQFFKEIPTDNRFGSVNWKKIVPKTGGDADQENEIYLTFLKLR